MLKGSGIVFRAVKYGETSVIAEIFTQEKGLRRFIGGNVRSAKSRMPFNLFQPMTVVDLVAYFRDDPEALNRLRELRAAELWTRIPFDIRRGAVALFMAEICRKSIQETEENRPLYDFLLDTLRWLDQTEHSFANLPLHFLLQLSGFLGFQPEAPAEPGESLFFDLKEGVFAAVEPQHQAMLRPEPSQALLALLEAPLEQCHAVALERAQRKLLLERLLQFYQLHVPGFSAVHSPEVLEMVFH
jgi:DNA repair protein RecO (recombination protein O)